MPLQFAWFLHIFTVHISRFLQYFIMEFLMASQPQEEFKNVQVRLQSNSLNSINTIAKRLHTNKTQVVATSVQLTDMLTERLSQGAKMYIETSDGAREQISFIGLTKV
jgi:hypothetical protein